MDFIYGLIAIAVLILAIFIKYRNTKIRGEWILASFLVGTSSLPIGLYLTPIIENVSRLFLPEGGLNQIFSILFIFIILSLCYTYLKKESIVFFIKISTISLLVVFVATLGWFSASMNEGGMFIFIEEVSIPAGENGRYITITQEELEENQPLKKAMNAYIQSNNHEFKVEIGDQRSVLAFFEKKQYATHFKIGEKYYKISYSFAD